MVGKHGYPVIYQGAVIRQTMSDSADLLTKNIVGADGVGAALGLLAAAVRLLDNLSKVRSSRCATAAASTEVCDMRKVCAAMVVVAPLMTACGPPEEPPIPELKGRWDVLSLAKASQSQRAQRVANSSQPAASDNCNVAYVSFSKRGVVM